MKTESSLHVGIKFTAYLDDTRPLVHLELELTISVEVVHVVPTGNRQPYELISCQHPGQPCKLVKVWILDIAPPT